MSRDFWFETSEGKMGSQVQDRSEAYVRKREKENLPGGHTLSTHLSYSSDSQLQALFASCPQPLLCHLAAWSSTAGLRTLTCSLLQRYRRYSNATLCVLCTSQYEKHFLWTLNAAYHKPEPSDKCYTLHFADE